MAASTGTFALLVLALAGRAAAIRRRDADEPLLSQGTPHIDFDKLVLPGTPSDFPIASGLVEGAAVALACTGLFAEQVDKLTARSTSEVISDNGNIVSSRFEVDYSCNGWAPHADMPLYVHWKATRNACRIELKYGNKARNEWCLEAVIGHQKFNHDPNVGYLDSIGNFADEVWTDACGTIKHQTKVLLPLQTELLRELGVKWMAAQDAAFFQSTCADGDVAREDPEELEASKLKVAATGKTFYQRVYGDAAFRFLHQSCADYMQFAHDEAQQAGMSRTAQDLLDLSKSRRTGKCSQLEQHDMEVDAFMQALQPSWKDAWARCTNFVADLAQAPACAK